jgi:hypothetical protein
MKARIGYLAVLVLLWPASVQAQAANIAGTYVVDFDSRVQMTAAGAEVTGRGKARMTLELRGDSVFGTWQVLDAPDARPPRALRGALQDGKVKLSAEPTEAVLNVNGEEQRRTIRQNFIATITGDEIRGTIESDSPMPGMSGITRKFEGKREK